MESNETAPPEMYVSLNVFDTVTKMPADSPDSVWRATRKAAYYERGYRIACNHSRLKEGITSSNTGIYNQSLQPNISVPIQPAKAFALASKMLARRDL